MKEIDFFLNRQHAIMSKCVACYGACRADYCLVILLMRMFPDKSRGWLRIGIASGILTPIASLMVVFAVVEVFRLREEQEYRAVLFGIITFAVGAIICVTSVQRSRRLKRDQRGFDVVERGESAGR